VASAFARRRLETAFLLDFEASWRVFWAAFGMLPVFAAPMPCCQLAGRLGITLMPSPEASAAVWIILFDGHIWIAVANNLALTILARSYHKLLALSRCTPWAVTW